MPVSDKNKSEPAARSAGRGVGWLLKKILGREALDRAAESARVLRREYEEGKRESEPEAPRPIPHQVKETEPGD